MVTINSQNSSLKYKCESCYYFTNSKGDFNKHVLSAKHKKITNGDIESNKIHSCICGKEFKYRQGLSRHKQTCKEPIDTPYISNNTSSILENPILILEILKQNQEFKNLILEERREFQNIITEQNAKMVELASNIGNNHHNTTNTTNTNSHNKFNLNVFLNEQCKDAMTLKDFVKNLEISMDEFINTGEHGFIEGLSQVMIKRINSMDIHDRPIHCTDLKRETVYIKDTDKWEKDANKEQLRKAVKGVAYKNERMRPIWYDNTPEVDILGSANCDKFLKYSASALGGCGKEETKSFEDKIMKNIMKEVTIDKQMLIE
jgi:hypothetical protein